MRVPVPVPGGWQDFLKQGTDKTEAGTLAPQGLVSVVALCVSRLWHGLVAL